MNQKLVNYGIHNENSDIRVHVCPVVRRVYVYSTQDGIGAIDTEKHRLVNGYQKGVEFATAKGYLVPPDDIAGIAAVQIRDTAWQYLAFDENDETSKKGSKATRLVIGMLESGLLPIPALAEEVTRADLQIDGADIIIRGKSITQEDIKIQVKCDFKGGHRELGGSGNLFLQVAECNPNKLY
jgi:hypothetical protein